MGGRRHVYILVYEEHREGGRGKGVISFQFFFEEISHTKWAYEFLARYVPKLALAGLQEHDIGIAVADAATSLYPRLSRRQSFAAS